MKALNFEAKKFDANKTQFVLRQKGPLYTEGEIVVDAQCLGSAQVMFHERRILSISLHFNLHRPKIKINTLINNKKITYLVYHICAWRAKLLVLEQYTPTLG